MRIPFVLGLLILAGCSREDGERLARVGRLAGEKVREAAPPKTPLSELNSEATPAGRVRARLRSDGALARHEIQVHEGPDGIHLTGSVATADQAEWAVLLARSTIGVTNFVNDLTVAP